MSVFSRCFRRKSRLLEWLVCFSSVQRVTSTFCALRQLMHIYQLLPYVLNTSFSTHPKRLTWDKKRPLFYIFRHYATYWKLIRKFFSQFIVFWELLLSPVVEKVFFESFWALDMAPTWAVPGLFSLAHTCGQSCLHEFACKALERSWMEGQIVENQTIYLVTWDNNIEYSSRQI